jgi:hypothetical protein
MSMQHQTIAEVSRKLSETGPLANASVAACPCETIVQTRNDRQLDSED